jgi:hypothetical protein
MIRRYYPLPQPEKDCNAVELLSLNLMAGPQIEVQPGLRTVVGDVETFVPDRDIRTIVQRVENVAHFTAWLAAQESNPADTAIQQFVSGLLLYLWLQRRGLLPDAPV